jgi:hypothetical protein
MVWRKSVVKPIDFMELTARLSRVRKKGCMWAKCPKGIPQGINGWVETHPYQPALILRGFCPG